jgi:hypothetical protein
LTGRSKVLDSGFFDNQVWGALYKAWKGYIIAKNKDEYEKMQVYARRVQELQHDLGLEVDSFDNIGMSAFCGKLHRKIITFKNKKYLVKNIKLTDTNKKDLLIAIVKILQMIMIKETDSLMNITKTLRIS